MPFYDRDRATPNWDSRNGPSFQDRANAEFARQQETMRAQFAQQQAEESARQARMSSQPTSQSWTTQGSYVNPVSSNLDWRNQAVPQQGQQGQYFTSGGYREVKSATQAVLFGALAYKAATNAWNTGRVTKAQAVSHGLYCAMRWKVWVVQIIMFFVALWLPMALDHGVDPINPALGKVITLGSIWLLGFVTIPISYLQVVDISGFKRRFWYRFLRTCYPKRLVNLPWLLLASASALPFVAVFVQA